VKILIDMNLSPEWVSELSTHGWEAQHWSAVGGPSASDSEILEYASKEGFVVFTHDLDFGTLLAHRRVVTPSVIQLRGQEVTPTEVGSVIAAVLRDFGAELDSGALITVTSSRTRVRILPLR
jgi:predicted nuclease of predicted toxin-antitoxin system